VIAWIMRFYGSVIDFETAYAEVAGRLKERQPESSSD